MTRRTARAWGLAALVTLVGPPADAARAGQDRPQFRAAVTGVAVHVVVRERRTPIRGLRTEDFALTDSGVPQAITAVSAATLPVDVSLLVEQTDYTAFWRRNYGREMADVAAALAATDRLRVVSFGEDVWEVAPLGVPGAVEEVSPPVLSSATSVYDALAGVLMRPAEGGRQHVAIVLVAQQDSMSFINARVLAELAGRSDARVYVLASSGSGPRAVAPARYLSRASNLIPWDDQGQARHRSVADASHRLEAFWASAHLDLIDVADLTGGGRITPGRLTGSIAGAVRGVLEEIRAGYVLYYVPAGVPDTGWHPIEVTLKRPGGFEVRARPGYMR